MSFWILVCFLLACRLASSNYNQEFIFSKHLKLDKVAEITPNGSSAMPITNTTGLQAAGQVFYSMPFRFKNSSTGTVHSFSTSFVFSINLLFPIVFKEAISLVISPSKTLPQSYMPSQQENNTSKNIFSIKLGSSFSHDDYEEIENHVSININDVTLIKYSPLGYFTEMNGELKKVKITSGEAVQVWVDYDGREKELNVTLSPLSVPKPHGPLLSVALDLSPLILENMYVGISTSNLASLSSYYILGWSFKMNGQVQGFDNSQLAKFSPSDGGLGSFRNFTVIQLECTCLPQRLLNWSRKDKFLTKNNGRLRGEIWAA